MGFVKGIDNKIEASHVEKVMSEDRGVNDEYLESLDTIELTQSGKFAWLVSITAGVGGLLFGNDMSTVTLERSGPAFH